MNSTFATKEENSMQNKNLAEKERAEKLYQKILAEAARRGNVTLSKKTNPKTKHPRISEVDYNLLKEWEVIPALFNLTNI